MRDWACGVWAGKRMKLYNIIFEVPTNVENSVALFLGFSTLTLLTFGAREFFEQETSRGEEKEGSVLST